MSCVDAPWKPRSANTRAAASMISAARRRGEARTRRARTPDVAPMRFPSPPRTCIAALSAPQSVYRTIEFFHPGGNAMKGQSGQPPFRADHVGSLLRPHRLRQAFKQHASKELDDTVFA